MGAEDERQDVIIDAEVVDTDKQQLVSAPVEVEKPVEAPPQERPKLFGIDARLVVLPLLTVQNAGAVLLMRSTRSMPGEDAFSSQSAVIMQEIIKGLSCIAILLWQEGTVSSAWNVPSEALKTSVPAVLYLIQNNFQYFAAGILDVVTYSVSAQTKIIWTGLFTVLILKRELACNKWTAIFLIAFGVSLVNLGGKPNSETHVTKAVTDMDRVFGLFFILTAAGCSSLAGVYFEKILKGCKVSLWTRNLQLAFYSVWTGLFALYMSEKDRNIVSKGFFYGYTPLTWTCVLMNAYGGLLVGCVIKYADAVLKDVSIGASICLSTLGSVMLFGYTLQAMTVIGTLQVTYAIFIYSGTLQNPAQCASSEAK
eukprot:TRINITY_DN782_c0_g2_i1.p1 TRINITY_DN782_c0_g2~~TRINITY_DN782_c0_g2_i1.p1  ORF type:complete len:384 (+),score=152.44 TRINITY_DN782_c0_g2_i1:53-1153(+)